MADIPCLMNDSVKSSSAENLMNARNLGVVFGRALFDSLQGRNED
jgi:hypothetical protein